jgi:hypothetical protein
VSCTTTRSAERPNTSFAAEILCNPPERGQMTTERKEGGFRRKIGSHLFRRMISRAKFASSLDIRSPPTHPTPIPSSNGPYPASSVASSSQGSSGKHAQAIVQHNHLVRETTSRSRPLSTSRRSSSDLVDLGHELESAIGSILQAYPKYIGFIV